MTKLDDSKLDLTGKLAIVTGGSKGIGADIAITFAKAGADLAIIGRDRKGLDSTASAIHSYRRQCHIIEADLADASAIEQAAQKLKQISLHWDILVNNAGIAKFIPLLETTVEDWENLYRVNLLAAFHLSKLIVPLMITRRRGKIINISSIGTFHGTPGLGAYAATKAGLNQLTKTMAVEWGGYNIQVNAICPTVVLTEMGKQVWNDPNNAALRNKIEQSIPLGRFAEPREVSSLALYLASESSDFISGTIIPVDNGARHT